MTPQIEKQAFRNETQGWVGAVVIGVKGEETGIPVEPGGIVWLSEAEQILTANAPRLATDNPFVAQTYSYTDPETGELKEGTITPLVPINEGRYVPAMERHIPGLQSGAEATAAATAAATGDEPEVVVTDEPTAETTEEAVLAAPQPPARAASAAAAAPEPPAVEEPQEPPHQVPTPPPGPTPPGAAEPLPGETADVGTGDPLEETAAQSPGPHAEETGAAVEPAGTPPVGEYKAHEEVGTPEAPAQAPAPLPPSEG